MKYAISLVLLLFACAVSAVEVHPFGPDVDSIYYANLQQDPMSVGAIENGNHYLYVYEGSEWQQYSYFTQGLPITGTWKLNDSTLMVAMGDGTFSDGVYNFDLTTHEWTINEWFMRPNFLRYCPGNQKYYVGERDGLYQSADAINWSRITAVGSNKCDSFDSFDNHLIANNGSLVKYSNDSGQTWQQADTQNLRGFRFSGNGIYAIMAVESDSDGLWYSDDFGATWNVLLYTSNLNVIGPDFNGQFPLGWSQPNQNGNYLELYVSGQLHDLNVSHFASPVRQLEIFPLVNTPAFYVVNYTGCFWCANFMIMGNEDELIPPAQALDVKIWPNPAQTSLHLEFAEKQDVIDLMLFDLKGRMVLSQEHRKIQNQALDLNLPELPPAVYLLQVRSGKSIYQRRILLY